MGEEADEAAAISGDAVVIQVLAAAQRFAAWYVEFLSCDVTPEGDDEPESSPGRHHVAARVQHAVFDLIAAVHAMNRHYSGNHARMATASPGNGQRVTPEPVH
ncbi:MAG: hypothetical protein NZM07_09950 [Elioraea sp.]|nr:hypothetical protein [Elioraea sp.]